MMPTVADYRTSNLLILRAPAIEKVPVTAEVASSSLVVPAIHSKRVARISFKPLRAQKGRAARPFCALFPGYEAVASCPAMRDSPPALEEKTCDITAACAACFAGVTACV